MVAMGRDAASSTGGREMKLRCWWFGCKPDPLDYAPPEYLECMYCGECVPYSDLVGDTRHRRLMDWLSRWHWRRVFPKKCSVCGERYGHKPWCDWKIPF